MADGGSPLPEPASEERGTYTSAYALSQFPPEPDPMKHTTVPAPLPPASNDAMLLAFERARLGARCAQSNAVPTSSKSHRLLAANGLRCKCGHSARGTRRGVYLQIVVSFVLLIFGLLYDLQGLRFAMQYCTFTGLPNADKTPRCFLRRMDFSRNYHNATAYYGGGNRTLGIESNGEIQSVVNTFDDTPPDGDFMHRALALFDVIAAVQANLEQVPVGNITGSAAKVEPVQAVHVDVILAVIKAALPLDTNPETFHHLSTRFYSPNHRHDLKWNRAQWQQQHDHFGISTSTMNLIITVIANVIEAPMRIILVFLGRVKLARALLARRDTPTLYSVAIGTSTGRRDDDMAALEVKTRLDRVLLKAFFCVTVPTFFGLGLGAFNLLNPELYTYRTPLMSVCSFASFLMAVSAFTFAPLIWSHVDTHIKNVRRTGQMCMGLVLTESNSGRDGKQDNKVNFREIARHYAEVIYSLDMFCREWRVLVCLFMLAAGSPALTNTLMACKLIAEGKPVPTSIFIVGFSTVCVVTALLGKMASLKTEHDRLRDLVSLRRLGGSAGLGGRQLSGLEVKDDDAVLVLINLSKSRGAVRFIGNMKVTYGVMMAVPEAVLALLAAALLPIIASEISGASA